MRKALLRFEVSVPMVRIDRRCGSDKRYGSRNEGIAVAVHLKHNVKQESRSDRQQSVKAEDILFQISAKYCQRTRRRTEQDAADK